MNRPHVLSDIFNSFYEFNHLLLLRWSCSFFSEPSLLWALDQHCHCHLQGTAKQNDQQDIEIFRTFAKQNQPISTSTIADHSPRHYDGQLTPSASGRRRRICRRDWDAPRRQFGSSAGWQRRLHCRNDLRLMTQGSYLSKSLILHKFLSLNNHCQPRSFE